MSTVIVCPLISPGVYLICSEPRTANLAFGIADDGRLYTAFGRTTFHKGGTTPEDKRSYSVDEWLAKDKLYFNSAISSHAALEQVLLFQGQPFS